MAGAPIPQGDCRDCPELTTSVATVGLCLADTTPIAVVVTRDCNGATTEDGWIDLTTGIFTPGSPPPGTGSCLGDTYDFALSGWLCDTLPDGSVAGIALVQIERDGLGAVIGITLIGVDGLPYVPIGTMARCPEDRLAAEVLCDAGAAGIPFVRFYTYSPVGAIPSRDTNLDGAPYVVVGPVVRCIEEVTGTGGNPVVVDVNNWRDDAEYHILCDEGAANTPFVRRYDVDNVGGVTATDTALDGTTPYIVVGPVGICPVIVDNTGGSNILMGRERLNAASVSWTFANTGGGRVRSVTVICVDDGVTGGPVSGSDVTVTDSFGNTFQMNTGQTFTWSTDSIDDELVDGGTFSVDLGAGGANAYVDVIWTEVL